MQDFGYDFTVPDHCLHFTMQKAHVILQVNINGKDQEFSHSVFILLFFYNTLQEVFNSIISHLRDQ